MNKMNHYMVSWIARIAVLGLLLVTVGLAQENATILLPVDVNVTIESSTENLPIGVVPLTNTRQVLELSGTDPIIFDSGLLTKSTNGYVTNPDYTASMNVFLTGNETATYPTRKIATIGLVHLAANK
ncbi:MAG: hypothetical protein XD88_0742 [Methanocalculus sp. 52_23]|jgi:hypothetical protein|nr:MAG: hypothetical protein XD88_0742 [Methanocalculus sp. 52_23]